MTLLVTSTVTANAAPKPNELNVSHKGNAFQGQAGSGWSDEELKSNAFGSICSGGKKVATIKISRNQKGTAKFQGTCSP